MKHIIRGGVKAGMGSASEMSKGIVTAAASGSGATGAAAAAPAVPLAGLSPFLNHLGPQLQGPIAQMQTIEALRSGEKAAEAAAKSSSAMSQLASAAGPGKQAIIMFMENFMKYLIIFIVIFILYLMFRKASRAPKTVKITSKVTGLFGRLMKFLNTILNKVFSFGPQIRKITSMFNVLGGDVPDIPRNAERNGRCNNVSWIETDEDGHMTQDGVQGYCETTTRPANIKWQMDVMRMPEYAELPSEIKKQIKNQLKVTIPWDHNEEASFYVPQCDQAVYTDTCDPKHPNDLRRCMKADILEDNGMSCRLREQTSLSYAAGVRSAGSNHGVSLINPKNAQIMTLVKRLQADTKTNTKVEDDPTSKYTIRPGLSPKYNVSMKAAHNSTEYKNELKKLQTAIAASEKAKRDAELARLKAATAATK